MRFDYANTGESGGAFERLRADHCVEDTLAVADHLTSRWPTDTLSMAGVRLGALFAMAAWGRLPVCRLFLIDPVTDAAAYERELERAALFRSAFAGDRAGARRPAIDLGGFVFTREFLDGLTAVERVVRSHQDPPTVAVVCTGSGRVRRSGVLARVRPVVHALGHRTRPFWARDDAYRLPDLERAVCSIVDRTP